MKASSFYKTKSFTPVMHARLQMEVVFEIFQKKSKKLDIKQLLVIIQIEQREQRKKLQSSMFSEFRIINKNRCYT